MSDAGDREPVYYRSEVDYSINWNTLKKKNLIFRSGRRVTLERSENLGNLCRVNIVNTVRSWQDAGKNALDQQMITLLNFTLVT
jgi:hypothetical protein